MPLALWDEKTMEENKGGKAMTLMINDCGGNSIDVKTHGLPGIPRFRVSSLATTRFP